MTYSIGEISQRLKIAPSAIRYYEKEGLLPFLVRTVSGIREFDDIDLEWLIIIDSLKKTGMPLKEIKDFVSMFEGGEFTVCRRLEIIQRHRAFIEKQVQELNEIIQALDFKQQHYGSAQKNNPKSAPESLSMDELPPQMQAIRRRVRGD